VCDCDNIGQSSPLVNSIIASQSASEGTVRRLRLLAGIISALLLTTFFAKPVYEFFRLSNTIDLFENQLLRTVANEGQNDLSIYENSSG